MQAAQTTFISSTNWTDRVGPSAALATISKYCRLSAEKQLIATGNRVKDIWRRAAGTAGLRIRVTGLPTLAAFAFDSDHANALNTRFTIEMLREGFLGFRQCKAALAHDDHALSDYERTVARIFDRIAADPHGHKLETPRHHAGFQRLTKE